MNTQPVIYNEMQNDEILQFVKGAWGNGEDGLTVHKMELMYFRTDIRMIDGKGAIKVLLHPASTREK